MAVCVDLAGFIPLLDAAVIWATFITEAIYPFGAVPRAGRHCGRPWEVDGETRRRLGALLWPRLMTSPS